MATRPLVTNKTPEQLEALQAAFATNPSPGMAKYRELGDTLGLTAAAVNSWFQKRRVRGQRGLPEPGPVVLTTPPTGESPLEPFFRQDPNPDERRMAQIAAAVGVSTPKVRSWFWRRRQTESSVPFSGPAFAASGRARSLRGRFIPSSPSASPSPKGASGSDWTPPPDLRDLEDPAAGYFTVGDAYALRNACLSNNAGLVRYLLTTEPGLNWLDRRGLATLHYAVWSGTAEIVGCLLGYPQVDVNLRSRDGVTPLSMACALGHLHIVQQLVLHPRVAVDYEDASGHTALSWAAEHGRLDVLRWLVVSGKPLSASVGRPYGEGEVGTPLEIARGRGHHGVARVLERLEYDSEGARKDALRELGLLCEEEGEPMELDMLCDLPGSAIPTPSTHAPELADRLGELAAGRVDDEEEGGREVGPSSSFDVTRFLSGDAM